MLYASHLSAELSNRTLWKEEILTQAGTSLLEENRVGGKVLL